MDDTPPRADGSADGSRTIRAAFAIVGCCLAVLPFTAVTYAPATDLPQHLAQIRLLEELLGSAPRTMDASELAIQWSSPNVLVYLPLYLAVRLFGPVLGGKVLLAALVLLQTLVIHWVAARRGRPPGAAVLAGIFVFSNALYWGFLNFLLAVPFLLLFVDHASRPVDPGRRARDFAVTMTLGLLGYATHSLALLVGMVATVGFALSRRDRPRDLATRGLALVPVLVAAALWFPRLSARRRTFGFDTAPHWWTTPLDRLSPTIGEDIVLGGLHGVLEPATLVAVAVYAVACVVFRVAGTQTKTDRSLLAVGVGLVVFVLVAPNQYMTTIHFAYRFAAPAAMLLLLALPEARLGRWFAQLLPLAIVTLFSLGTTVGWVLFEQTSLSGLTHALRQQPGPARVLGLDFARQSPIVKGQPLLQIFAYAQAVHGGTLNFSFAEHGTGIVSYRHRRRIAWTPALEWFPRKVAASDLERFDYVFVVGTDQDHGVFQQLSHAAPLATEGSVRLYRPLASRR
ncbi:MAG: hypothetical protein U0230_07615 [Polyangiales bacterium]